jgi:hypothetical protein
VIEISSRNYEPGRLDTAICAANMLTYASRALDDEEAALGIGNDAPGTRQVPGDFDGRPSAG